METKNLLVSLAAVLIVAMFASIAAATQDPFASIQRVTVNGIEFFGSLNETAAVSAGEIVPVRVIFNAESDAVDVRVNARLTGAGSFSETTERFDVVAGGTYSRLLNIRMPFDIDPDEAISLEVTIENSQNGTADEMTIPFRVQRASYVVEILSVNKPDQVRAGQSFGIDLVLKNRGRQLAEDTYVRARIPELGVSTTAYFGDLSPEDESDPDRDDAVERRVYLNVPANARPGLYAIELEAFNSDSSSVRTERVAVVEGGQGNQVISSATSKTLAVGEEKTYSMTIVNAGDTIQVYNLAIDAPQELSVETDDTVVVVPAGSSKTVNLRVMSSEEGTYNFGVHVNAGDQLVKTESFVAKVEGKAAPQLNASVVLTVVLAVIFVVLVVVLIVLLTRKPQKGEEFGESYY